MEAEPLGYVRKLDSSSHSLCPFEDQDFRNKVFTEYVRGAVERNEAVTHASDNVSRDTGLVSELQLAGNRPSQIRILPIETAYELSSFSFEKMMRFWDEERANAFRQGFAGLRGSADVAGVLSRGYASEMLNGESSVGRVLSAEGLTFLCFYDVSALPTPESILGLFSAHGHVIFPGVAGRLY